MYHREACGLLMHVNAVELKQPRGLAVGLQNASESDASSPPEVSVWVVSAAHFSRWRDGDHTALDDLVRSLSPVLWHVVRAYGLDKEQAEDVVQTAWLTLVRRHESISDPKAVSAWLMTTARREAWRVSRVSSKVLTVGDEVIEARVPHSQAAEAEVVTSDEEGRLWSAVHQLSERCQRLLRIVAFDDRPDYAGIAKEMDMPVGSIGPTRGRCLSKLKALLEKEDYGHE